MNSKYSRIVFVLILGIMILLIEKSAFSLIKDLFFEKNYSLYQLIFSGLVIFPIIFIFTTFIGFKYYTKIGSYLYTVSAVWFGFVIYLFIGQFIIALITSLGILVNLTFPFIH